MEMLSRGFQAYRRAIGVALLIMAGFQIWIAHTIYTPHPILASVEALMAAVLVFGVALAW